jgi:hypothetical protein
MSKADTGMVAIIMAESAALWSALWVVDAKWGDSARFQERGSQLSGTSAESGQVFA